MRGYRYIALLITVFLTVSIKAQLVINEFMAANASTHLETDYYNYVDWIEILNTGSTSVNLNDYYISDDAGDLKKWRLPAFNLFSGRYYLIYCDKKENGKHTNFGLATDGETIILSDIAGNIIDKLTYGEQYTDISLGRNAFNPELWFFCASPTPGTSNLTTTAIKPAGKVIYSIPAGRLSSPTSLELSGENIRITSNGQQPDINSPVYTKPFDIGWTIIIKSRSYEEGYLPGEIYANTYFYNEHEFTLPVVSLSFNPDFFYDNIIGIHVTGTNGTEGDCGGWANYNQPWERAAYFEYFDQQGKKQLSQQVGVKIAGGCTRDRDQKSLSIYACPTYGDNDFDYQMFKQKPEIDRYKSFMLRNSGNDQDQTLLRDAFIQALVNRSMDLDYQSYQPVTVYFNGEYRGIMNLREKVDEDYFQSNYGLGSDEIDFLENDMEIIRGSDEDYAEIVTFLNANMLSDQANYEWVASKIDLQEYINYMTTQIYIAKRDWPSNNLKYWKKKDNGKWRWILFDTDYGFGFRMDEEAYTHQSFHYVTEESANPPWSTLLFRRMIENESFKRKFLSTFITHMYTSFHPDWCNYVLDSLSSIIDHEIYYNQIKYGRTKSMWQQYLDTLKEYPVNRISFMPGYVQSFYNLDTDQVDISISVADPDQGKVSMNAALVQHYPFTVKTWKELPLELKAVPEKGYRFSHWEYTEPPLGIYSENISIQSDTSFALAVEPVFKAIEPIEGVYINEIAPVTDLFYDEYGESSGFVELYNSSGQEVVLNSYYLSDDKNNLVRFAIPDSTVIPAQGFILIYTDGEEKQGPMHTSFKASTNGETMILSQKVGETFYIRDSVSFSFLFRDYSYGKYSDGTGEWQYMLNMTPGSPNDPDRYVAQKCTPSPAPDFTYYPNPTGGTITISADQWDPYSQSWSMDIIDITGKVVYPRIWINDNNVILNLANMNDGLYFIRIFKEKQLIKADIIMVIK